MMFGALYSIDGPAADALLDVAADFTPRFELHGQADIVLDLTGLERLFGGAEEIGHELRAAAADRHTRVRVAIAHTYTAARLLAMAERHEDVVVVQAGAEAEALAPLPIDVLTTIANLDLPAPSHLAPSHLPTFLRWGIHTLGALAALPPDALAARLGAAGTQWQRLACGEDPRPLRPEVPKERFEQALDLEWPIDGLEPLSFVLGRLLEPLIAHLERRGRGAAVLHIRLHLVTRTVHERSLQLPVPMRDARTFRTLLLLDLESHPPSAAIDRVVVAIDPTPARVVQLSLLTRPLPSPEQLSTLMARLAALMGEDRCGSPVVVDTWQPGAFAMKPFAPPDSSVAYREKPQRRGAADTAMRAEPATGPVRNPDRRRASVSPWPVAAAASNQLSAALRRFRIPVPARVRMEHDKPVYVAIDRAAAHLGSRIDAGSRMGGPVQTCAGPWRTSGDWWREPVNADRVRCRDGRAPQDAASPHQREQNKSLCLCVSVARNQWDRDEWDVTLGDGATYRLFRERATAAWFVEGTYD
jgi:protein ImuB